MTIVIVFAFLCAFLLRLLPTFIHSKGLAVDHWYWKAYIDVYREHRLFPPVLPQYLLDMHQWYPPLFPLMMVHLPERFFNRYSQALAILLDMIRMLLLLGVAYWLTGGNYYAVGITGIVYAVTPILVSYNIQLNPRGLGALFLDGLVVLLLWIYLFNGPFWAWGGVLLLSGLILLTHKMTTQLFWFMCLGAGLMTLDWHLFALIPGSILTALIMSKGFYWKVMRAHWDIVTFWNRNWPWLQAHPIKESPVYGEPGFETSTKFHKKGLEGVRRHLLYLAGFNPSVWVLLAYPIIDSLSMISLASLWVGCWLMLVTIFSLLTVFVPQIKCLGSGYYYLYNAAFPASLLWGLWVSPKKGDMLPWILIFVALIVSLLSVVSFYRRLQRSNTHKKDAHFDEVLEYLKSASKGTVMCLPPQWYDRIAYISGQPVLYGGHGYGFKLLEPTFPRLMIPIKEVIEKYNVRYLVALDGYLPKSFVEDLKYEPINSFGEYKIFQFGNHCD